VEIIYSLSNLPGKYEKAIKLSNRVWVYVAPPRNPGTLRSKLRIKAASEELADRELFSSYSKVSIESSEAKLTCTARFTSVKSSDNIKGETNIEYKGVGSLGGAADLIEEFCKGAMMKLFIGIDPDGGMMPTFAFVLISRLGSWLN